MNPIGSRICQTAAASPAKPVDLPVRIAKGHGNILIVDDEEAIVILGARSLEKLGYSVVGNTSSLKALELFSQNPDHFDLVVTDQTMPNLTGVSLAQELWTIRPGLPIIVSSGYSEQIPSEKATSLGFHAYLSKPYTVAELAKAVSNSVRN